MLHRILAALALLLVLAVALLFVAGLGWFGRHEGPGTPTAARRPDTAIAAERGGAAAAATVIGVPRPKQVLFGDLHVHTTFSADAFILSLPLAVGEGAHPPADACDFARFCSGLDFWSITDHAEAISPAHWRETVDAVRQCNDVAGDPANPDTVAFLGWEWTQVGAVPDEHYGHKNVVLRDLEPVPARPIAARGTLRAAFTQNRRILGRGLVALIGGDRVRDFITYIADLEARVPCPEGVPVRELPADCLEMAETPADLFGKLDDWGLESIVIPHGTTWGFYTPPGSKWDKQLAGPMHDPDRQTLIEVYSGHGNSEEWRDDVAVSFDAAGNPVCPPPTERYLPTCWRAGEIVRERCVAEGAAQDACEERAAQARANAAAAFGQAHLTVPGAKPEDWLDAGQCTDCVVPAFNYRPGGAAQYILALSNFDAGGAPRRFRLGFIASSDNHFARPGTGYKAVHRRGFTESNRVRYEGPLGAVLGPPPDEVPMAESHPFLREQSTLTPFQLFELERQASFFTTGGLVAVHADGRDRGSIWEALRRREVYGTSGPRILLWFDLLNPPGSLGQTLPMGGETRMASNPIFQVRAVGSLEQKPGCPDWAGEALGAERLASVCLGECYHPAETRRRIARIEVVRIRPQARLGEGVSSLIEDPWRSFACEPSTAGCSAAFEDPDFAAGARDAVYYARAVEEPAPKINAGQLRCERDAQGRCTEVALCGADDADDCLGTYEPRAWSSPIYVDFEGGTPARDAIP
jgi:hypothetical protein